MEAQIVQEKNSYEFLPSYALVINPFHRSPNVIFVYNQIISSDQNFLLD